MKFPRIIRLSRPRFWIYEFGTYALGVCIGVQAGGQWYGVMVGLFALFFLFPANILIYGINDVFDYETDKLNPKKTGYEDLLVPELHKKVYAVVFASNIVFVVLALFIPWKATLALFFFYFFAYFYSAPPIRAKARAFFDSFFSAGHYVVTGVFGYFLTEASGNVTLAVCAGLCWAMAMHAYSAVPDIEADKASGISTIAIVLGKHPTIILCGFLYVLAGLAVFPYIAYWGLVLAIPYVILMYMSYYASEQRLFQLYTYFPKLNSLIGMILFFMALFLI